MAVAAVAAKVETRQVRLLAWAVAEEGERFRKRNNSSLIFLIRSMSTWVLVVRLGPPDLRQVREVTGETARRRTSSTLRRTSCSRPSRGLRGSRWR